MGIVLDIVLFGLLYCFFDQVRYFEVSEEELLKAREDFRTGQYKIKIEDSTFDFGAYTKMVASIQPEVAAMKARQQVSLSLSVTMQ